MSVTVIAPTSLPEPGGFVTHTVQITNHINDISVPDFTNIYLAQIADTFYGDLTSAANSNIANSTCTLATIAAGATYECMFAGVFTGNAGAVRTHTIEVVGVNAFISTVPAAATHTVQIAPRAPTLSVRKTAATTIPEPGGPIQYTITVTNTSAATDPVVLTVLRDSVFGNLVNPNNPAIANSTCTLAAIAPGNAYVCSFLGQVDGNAGESLLNTATARASDDEGAFSPFASSNHTVTIVDVLPVIGLTASATPNSVLESGAEVSFTVEVTNKSIESVTLQPLTSPELGSLAGKGSCAASAVLVASGELYSCKFGAPVSGDASGPAQQIAITAQAADDEGNDTTARQANTISFTDAQPAIDVQLGSDPDDIPEGGADVLFKVSVKNQKAEPVQLDQLTDILFGDLNGLGDCVADGSQIIAGNETYLCTFTEQVIGDFGDPKRSYLATGVASDNEGNVVEDQDGTNVGFLNVPAEIAVSQSPAKESVPEGGEDVVYDLLIENRSLVDMVTISQLSDSLLGDLTTGGGDLLATNCAVPLVLQPNASTRCNFTVRVIGNAGSKRTSEATAAGNDEDGESVSAKGSATVQIADIPSSLQFDVTADGDAAPPVGRTIAYTVAVQNDSLVDQVTVNALRDSKLGDLADATNDKLRSTDCMMPQSLNIGQTYTCHYSVLVAGELGVTISSIVTVEALDDDGLALERMVERLVQIAEPVVTTTKKDILLIDADADQVVSAGDTILYQISVQNRGNVAAYGAVFEDTPDAKTTLLPESVQTSQGQFKTGAPGEEASIQIILGELAAGGSVAISFQVVINVSAASGELFNQAVVRFDNPYDSTTGQSSALSDDPDTAALGDATATPIGGFSSAVKVYLPVMKQ